MRARVSLAFDRTKNVSTKRIFQTSHEVPLTTTRGSMMASPNISRRRRRSEDEDITESTPLSQASSPKRPRLNPADSEAEATGEDARDESGSEEADDADEGEGGEEEHYEEESDAESDASGSSDVIANPPQITPHDGLGPGGYKPGAIVRIKVTNFVTYTAAEFFPGPKLNMVIGPNGTGKSTLVCAICLGLGWGPQVRAIKQKFTALYMHCPLTNILCSIWGAPKTWASLSNTAAKRP
jgi:hypothetical protein